MVNSCSFLEDVKPRFTGANTGPFFLFEPYLMEVRTLIVEEENAHLTQALDALLRRADDRWLELEEPYSVVQNRELKKDIKGVSPHDYVSIHSYAWPDPDAPLGFEIKDGQLNPNVDDYDRVPLANMAQAVEDLSLAYFFTGETRYAEKTAEYIKTWFLNEETRMNPHFNYTQLSPGENFGTGNQGIVEAREFIRVIDGVSLIYDSAHWTENDHYELKRWFYEFLNWIFKNYNPDAFAQNDYGSNVASWLDAQKTSYILFTEQEEMLNSRRIMPLAESVKNRIDDTGKQPREANRRRPQHYTYFNLKGLIQQAEMRTRAGINPSDTWSATESYGPRLKKALDWLTPYAEGTETFIIDNENFYRCRYIELYRPAAVMLNDPKYEEVVQTLMEQHPYSCADVLTFLTHPPLVSAN